MVDAQVQTDPEPSPPCYGMKGRKVDTEHEHTCPKGQRVKKKVVKRDRKWPSQHVLPEPDHIQEVFEANPLNQSTPIKKTPVCNEVGNPDGPDRDETEGCSGVEDYESNDPHDTSFHC